MKMSNVIKVDEQGRKYVNDFYVYVAAISSTLNAAASATVNVNIEADANFTWVKSAVFASLAGAAQTNATAVLPQVTVQIQDSGSGRLLQNVPVPISSIAGNGQLPFVLPVPRLFKARSTIGVTFANGSAAENYSVLRLAMIGYKTFYL